MGRTEGGPPDLWDSAPAWWETGLLDWSEWQGEWIGASLAGDPRTTIPAPCVRKTATTPHG